jgi:putative transposase
VWKAKFGGMDVSTAKRVKALEDEHARLKRLLVVSLLDRAALKDQRPISLGTPVESTGK